jgi:hypothetical protein
MLWRGGLKILDARKTIPRLIGSLHGTNKADVVALFAYRLHLLEKRLADSGIDLDWRAI